ncbi:MAG TPA: hypothetical protein DEP45_03460 [Armatimonadetes bacterium]|nr:hypothetical protein [Armatimonadota bacterium]
MTVQSDLGKTDALSAVEVAEPSSHGRVKLIALKVAVALVTILLIGTVTLAIATNSWVKSGRIAPKVTIGGLAVGGMTADEAVAALNDQWLTSLPQTLSITFPEGQWEAEREELGAQYKLEVAAQQAVRVGREGGLLDQMKARLNSRRQVNVTVPMDIDEEMLADAMAELAEMVNRDPVDADIEVSGTKVDVIPGVAGRRLDGEATGEAVTAALADPASTTVEAVVQTVEPAVTAEDLSHIEVVLAEYSTKYRAHQTDRTHNLGIAAGKLNEHVLHPGETFSFNGVVGQRLATDGYREAPIFIGGEVEPSLAGGICQIASTLYNVALLANLDMVERHHHSRPVDYVPTGRDATVYWGVYDLKFRNPFKHPILLLADVGGGYVTFKILGSADDNAEVEIPREGLTRIGRETKEIKDPELEEGKREVEKEGRDGWRVTVYRKATRDGKLIRDEKLHTDVYAAQAQVIRVGAKPPEKPEEGAAGAAASTPAKPGAARPGAQSAPGASQSRTGD